jgi:hypothetical protein
MYTDSIKQCILKMCNTLEEAAAARKELERIHWADR